MATTPLGWAWRLLLVFAAAASSPLRVNWRSVPVRSDLAKAIEDTQSNCAGQIMTVLHNRGFGSDLHKWSHALCLAHHHNQSLIVRTCV